MDSVEPLFRDNLKVHFASCENISWSLVLKNTGVKYALYTCFPYVAKRIGIKCFQINHSRLYEIENLRLLNSCVFKHTILDSGLFTLMFGAMKGKKDASFIETWYEHLVEFVRENNVQSTCVEIDCQKVLGVDYAWRFRERMRNDLPNNRQINVFHIEDGRKGLDRLIEFSNYIALSVPEWRIARKNDYRRVVLSLAQYIKKRSPGIDVHLLGCTDVEILRRAKFCTSADSTSWVLAGSFRRSIVGRKICDDYEHSESRFLKDCTRRTIEELEAFRSIPVSQNMKNACYSVTISAYMNKEFYSTIVGSQG